MKGQQVSQIAIIVAAGLSVAVADAFIKKAGVASNSMTSAMTHPLMAAALGFYSFQIVLFAYVFVRRWDLGIVALLQMAFYAATCVLVGRFIFGERVTLMQGVGMVLTFCGAALMNGGGK
jgi:multidrug transporter EmrE-like cation transporter